MVSAESQVVHCLLFFSPSAAALCSGTLDPTLGPWLSRSAHRPARDPAGPEPGSGSRPAGDVPGFFYPCSLGVLAGSGRASPDRSLTRLTLLGVSTGNQGGAAAGPPDFGNRGAGLRPHCLHALGSLRIVSTRSVCLSCRGGGFAAQHRQGAARWEPHGAAWLMQRGQNGVRADRFIAGRSSGCK